MLHYFRSTHPHPFLTCAILRYVVQDLTSSFLEFSDPIYRMYVFQCFYVVNSGLADELRQLLQSTFTEVLGCWHNIVFQYTTTPFLMR
ncbi:hypothetical protein M5689_006767 [Euphorbia peplus]|nr:hypothetical protein M5689_006767 [Euphorbia peplus]